jgi:hypothetical protein
MESVDAEAGASNPGRRASEGYGRDGEGERDAEERYDLVAHTLRTAKSRAAIRATK